MRLGRIASASLLLLFATSHAMTKKKLQSCIKEENWVKYCDKAAPGAPTTADSACITNALSRLKIGQIEMKKGRVSLHNAKETLDKAAADHKAGNAAAANPNYTQAGTQADSGSSEFLNCSEQVDEMDEYLKAQEDQVARALQVCNQRQNAATSNGKNNSVARGTLVNFFSFKVDTTDHQAMAAAAGDQKLFFQNYRAWLERWEHDVAELKDEVFPGDNEKFDFSKTKSISDIKELSKRMHDYCATGTKYSSEVAGSARSSQRGIADVPKQAKEVAKPSDGNLSGDAATKASGDYLLGENMDGKGAKGTPNESFVKHLADNKSSPESFQKLEPAQKQELIDSWHAKTSADFEGPTKGERNEILDDIEKENAARNAAKKTDNKTATAAVDDLKAKENELKASPTEPKKSFYQRNKKMVWGATAVGVVGVGAGVGLAMHSNKKKKEKKKEEQEARTKFYEQCIAELSKTQTVVDPVEDCKNWHPSSR
jgi:hypothetical protein